MLHWCEIRRLIKCVCREVSIVLFPHEWIGNKIRVDGMVDMRERLDGFSKMVAFV